MIVIGGFIIGAIFGSMQAKRRGGRGLDMLQYGGAYGIFFAIIGMLLTIVIGRLI